MTLPGRRGPCQSSATSAVRESPQLPVRAWSEWSRSRSLQVSETGLSRVTTAEHAALAFRSPSHVSAARLISNPLRGRACSDGCSDGCGRRVGAQRMGYAQAHLALPRGEPVALGRLAFAPIPHPSDLQAHGLEPIIQLPLRFLNQSAAVDAVRLVPVLHQHLADWTSLHSHHLPSPYSSVITFGHAQTMFRIAP